MKQETKEYYQIILFTIIGILFIYLITVIIFEEPTNNNYIKLNNKTYSKPKIEVKYGFFNLSEKGFITGGPYNNQRVILLECINSTMIIKDNKLYCENKLSGDMK